MAGLVPAIHVLACGEDVDARPARFAVCASLTAWPGMTVNNAYRVILK